MEKRTEVVQVRISKRDHTAFKREAKWRKMSLASWAREQMQMAAATSRANRKVKR